MTKIAIVAIAAALSGCGTPTMIERKITVEKDPSGKVVRIIEEETARQTIEGKLIILENLKLAQEPKPRRLDDQPPNAYGPNP
jgi:hypothetical protein